jgi:hypothetical protein
MYAPKTPTACWYNLVRLRPFISLIVRTNIPHQPIHPLIHTPPIHRTTRNNTPIPILQISELQRLADLACALCAGLILLVRKYQQSGVAQFFFVEHGGEFFRGGGQALDVGAVDDEDYGSRVGVVAAPVWADGGLATEVLLGVKVGHVRGGVDGWEAKSMCGRTMRMLWDRWDTHPDVEVEVLVRYRFDVESYRGYCGYDLADLDCPFSFVKSLEVGLASSYLQSVK